MFASEVKPVEDDGKVNLPLRLARLIGWIPEGSGTGFLACVSPGGLQLDDPEGSLAQARNAIANFIDEQPTRGRESDAAWMDAVRYFQSSWEGTFSRGQNAISFIVPSGARHLGLIQAGGSVKIAATKAGVLELTSNSHVPKSDAVVLLRKLARNRTRVIADALQLLEQRRDT